MNRPKNSEPIDPSAFFEPAESKRPKTAEEIGATLHMAYLACQSNRGN